MDRMQEAEQEFEHEFEQELEAESELESENEQEQEGEFENEFEGEFEAESESGEQFLGSIVSGLGGLLGGSGETEAEFEQEFEGEFEQEQEFEQGEQFFGKLIRRAAPFLKRIAKVAAPLVSKAVSAAIPGPFGALAGRGISGLAGLLREQEQESLELEFEQEQEQEHELGEQEISQELGEHELMAEAMAHFAAQAEQELEAEAMVGAATTLTLSPNDRRTLRRMIPHLVRGAAVLTRVLRARRVTRPWVRVVPSIVRRTAQSLRRSAANGQPITRARAATTMARQTRRVLSSPRYCKAVLRRNVRAARATTRPLGVARRVRSLQ
jgi:hypothetical protein